MSQKKSNYSDNNITQIQSNLIYDCLNNNNLTTKFNQNLINETNSDKKSVTFSKKIEINPIEKWEDESYSEAYNIKNIDKLTYNDINELTETEFDLMNLIDNLMVFHFLLLY